METSDGHEQDLTLELPRLSVLHIQTPIVHYRSKYNNVYFEYEPNTTDHNAQMAERLLADTQRSSRLSLLALGMNFRPWRSKSPELQIFRRRPAFAPVELGRIRDIEPDSDLLEFRFHIHEKDRYEVD